MSAPTLKPNCRLYLAGPMKGYRESNTPAFNAAKTVLEAQGFIVLSPPDLTSGMFADGDLGPDDYRRAMQVDLAHLITCDGVAVLRGWMRSQGARYEVLTARFLYDMPVFDAATMVPIDNTITTYADAYDQADDRCEACEGWRDEQSGGFTGDDCWLCDSCFAAFVAEQGGAT